MFTKRLMVICLFFFTACTTSYAQSAGEVKIKRSAEKVVDAWSEVFAQKHLLVSGEGGIWCAYRSRIDGGVSYDIRKTDSIISPYLLIISGSAEWASNLESPKATRYNEMKSANFGFNTKEEAMQNVSENDFLGGTKRTYRIELPYALQEGYWVLKAPNHDFLRFLTENSSEQIKNSVSGLSKFSAE